MAISKIITGSLTNDTITSDKINDGAITNNKISDSANLGLSKFDVTGTIPTVSTLSISQKDPSSSSNVTITGTNFESIPKVQFMNTTTGARITSGAVTYTSSTSITATFSSGEAVGEYKVIVENPTGFATISTATIINSIAPIWQTDASLGTYEEGDSVNIQLLAYDDDSTSVSSYSLQSGSLPSGITLSGDSTIGSLTGTAPTVAADTAYNFTIRATDNESQTTDKAFSLTVADYNIGNSVMFDDSSGDYLSRTPSTTSNRQIFTLSGWFKRGTLGDNIGVFGATTNETNSPESDEFFLRFNSSDQLNGWDYPAGSGYNFRFTTTASYRDVSAWYHIVYRIDTTASSSSDRVRLYVNGVLQTLSFSSSPSSQNFNTQWNVSSRIAKIGKLANYANQFYDGYVAEVYHIDGQSLDASSFGETNSNGVWIPKKYTGSYGTNGFALEFDDSSDFGTDTSGNGNDFTANNFATTSASKDTPHLNYATLNPIWTSRLANDGTFSEGNTKINFSTSSDRGYGFSTIGVTSGKWYWEVKVTDITRATYGVGYDSVASFTNAFYDNSPSNGFGHYASSTSLNYDNTSTTYATALSNNDIAMIALDMDNHLCWFGKNGTWFNSATQTEIENGTATNDATTAMGTQQNLNSGEPVFPFVADLSTTGASGFLVNFGSPQFSISSGNSDGNGYGNFEYTVPTGFYALNTKNLATYG